MRLKSMPSFAFAWLFLGFLFSSNHVSAQVGIRAGANFYNVITKDKYGNEVYNDPKLNPGFHLGVTYDFPLAKNIYLQSAALFSTKGYRINNEQENSSVESYINPYYIEVPVNVLFAPKLGKGRLMLGAGPYIAYGIGGKGKAYVKNIVGGELVSENSKADLQFVSDINKANADKWTYGKPLDYGIQIMEGYEFNGRISVQVIGQLGLANIQPANAPSVDKLKNFGLGISVGYIF